MKRTTVERMYTAKVAELMLSGTGASGALEKLAPRSLAGDYAPGFLAEHLRKDLSLALESADAAELTLPGAETAFSLFDVLCQIGGARMPSLKFFVECTSGGRYPAFIQQCGGGTAEGGTGR